MKFVFLPIKNRYRSSLFNDESAPSGLFIVKNRYNSAFNFKMLVGWLFVWGFTTVPVTKTIRLSEWVTPGDTAIPGMTSLKDGDLRHSSALAQSPKEI